MNTVEKPMYEWNELPWKEIERETFKLQKRIYQASREGKTESLHKLQRLLITSWQGTLLAVRKVTQDNQGKKTAGIDGFKELSPQERLLLAKAIKREPFKTDAKPVRRISIPKPGTDEKRQLGIPVMEDRARQALFKLALEPEWEAKFEPNSYGFRPGRSAHDAIEAINKAINFRTKYVLDADIAKCFDRINHQALLDKISTFPSCRRVIKAWLEAGIMDGETLFPSEEGTPQGGVISPLLANIALHGLETTIEKSFTRTKRINGVKDRSWTPTVIRYADDFVVLHPDLNVVEECREIASRFLKDMGLELKPGKTRITHTLNEHDGKVGFEFLGFTIRQFPIGKKRSLRVNPHGERLEFKPVIKPSNGAIKRHAEDLKRIISTSQALSQERLIERLNPVITGWCRYYSTVMSHQAFSRMRSTTFFMLKAWALRRHAKKPVRWVMDNYWHFKTGKWFFRTEENALYDHQNMKVKRHRKVAEDKSPFDGDWVYWSTRMGRHPEKPNRVTRLLKKQEGRCNWCGLYFRDGDLIEVDHIVPKEFGGIDAMHNLQALHRHCHDSKTAEDRRGMNDNHQVTEEPDEVKVSRPVLKTSSSSDAVA